MRELKCRIWDGKKMYYLPDIWAISIKLSNAGSDYRDVKDLVPMLYIGQGDKNNKQIYAGDIIVWAGYRWEVIYEIQSYRLQRPIAKDADEDQPMSELEDDELEIVGNVWEDPQLIPRS